MQVPLCEHLLAIATEPWLHVWQARGGWRRLEEAGYRIGGREGGFRLGWKFLSLDTTYEQGPVLVTINGPCTFCRWRKVELWPSTWTLQPTKGKLLCVYGEYTVEYTWIPIRCSTSPSHHEVLPPPTSSFPSVSAYQTIPSSVWHTSSLQTTRWASLSIFWMLVGGQFGSLAPDSLGPQWLHHLLISQQTGCMRMTGEWINMMSLWCHSSLRCDH